MIRCMSLQIQFQDIRSRIMRSLQALHEREPNRFLSTFAAANTVRAFYAAALALGYAANGKELRDTWDEEVHRLCEDIRTDIAQLDLLFRTTLVPRSPQQRAEWDNTIVAAPGGKYAFRRDGSLEISNLDSDLDGVILHTRRMWNHVCNYDGAITDFSIRLDADQAGEVQSRLEQAQAIRLA
jgi:hypothetical protein